MAHDLHGYHYYEDDSSPYRKHCAAHDSYDELSVKFDMAVATGDVFAARMIGDALVDLGEEISYDEYLEDKYYDGYDSCFCRFVDYILGDHSAFVDVQFGYSGYRWVVEDFDGTKWGGILGVGGGFAIPLTQRFYGFVRVGAYETSDSRIDLFSPDSDFSARMQWLVNGEAGLVSARMQWLVNGEAGLGAPIFDRVGVRASAGFALADLKVIGPGGISDGKTVPGYTIDGGIDVKLAPKWKLTLDTRYTQLQETNFSPFPAVNLAVSPKIWTTTIGVRYTFGNTAGNRLW